jgi:hypothetical protein
MVQLNPTKPDALHPVRDGDAERNRAVDKTYSLGN